MVCKTCSAIIYNGDKFCRECGAPVYVRSKKRHLVCNDCGKMMTDDAENPILACIFCGSKNIIEEQEAVTIQKIKSQTYKETAIEREQIRKEKEIEKQRIIADSEKKKKEMEWRSKRYEFLIVFVKLLATIIILYMLGVFLHSIP